MHSVAFPFMRKFPLKGLILHPNEFVHLSHIQLILSLKYSKVEDCILKQSTGEFLNSTI